ncbi:IKI3 family-domain-containing protein [Podospora aff. communis PSN243]|uniref:Elongator complex protein 1 n=1 Tax=Podospora aff. communis PSN243 TaxID=3040156 RepID=A0AAV9H7I5_9PEZI|nr:IKI3 family-domain-containing protein [Podospora aff. communis PSN243]
MRNLRNIGHSGFQAPPSVSAITATCWDAARDEILVAYGPTSDSPRIELVRLSKDSSFPSSLITKSVASWESTNNGSPDIIRRLHHSSDTLTTCVVMSGGDIVTVTEDDDGGASSGDAHVEIVGTLEPSIEAARWSPDDEMVVFVTGSGKAVFMSRDFDVITETELTPEDMKLSRHVSVGWGKKETQFQGKGAKAKALRDPTIPERIDEGARSSREDGSCSISWRGDGAYVAVNYLQEGVRRAIRVYNREGELDSVSEPVDGLEGSLSWRPEGNLMAGIQRLSDRVDVVFFERNGLRHGQFSLRAPQDTTDALDELSLEWNTDSTVLAVTMKDRIQLWTTGNYHWYLKQEVPCGPHQGRAPDICWHAEKPLLFAAATSDNVIFDEYALTIAKAPAVSPNDYGAVAVIDGQTIKFTPFRTANVPPPMAMAEVEVESPAIDVAFAWDSSSMAVLHQVGMSIYTLEAKGARLCAPKLSRTIAIHRSSPHDDLPLQVAFSGSQDVFVLQATELEPKLLSHHVLETDEAEKTWEEVEAGTVITINSSDDGIIVQDHLGGLSRVISLRTTPIDEAFPTFMPWGTFVSHEEHFLPFGLSRNGHLYAGSRQLAKNCTSFLVTSSHLIFTTSSHLVKFVHLDAVDGLDVPFDDPENDERCRSIERGGRLVTAMPTKMSIVLQMSRGNLETVCPRAMVLAGIRELVEQCKYGDAFLTCRTQRVDMNILYDHRPEQFLENVGLFLEQVKDAANIDLFLSTLKDEDVSQTMYRDTKAGSVPDLEGKVDKPGKINIICDAVLHRLRAQKNANLQNIITAHVCKYPPALDDGLTVVAELMEEDETLAEQAVEHICFLVDVNKLFDHALGLYNLDLTLLVAQQSQRDPREYLPFIQELHRMPVLNRQFTIDDKLGRKEKALGHLKALDNFEDVEKYVVKHNLYQQALGLYRHDETRHRTLTDLYAAFLKSVSRFREAGLAYESLGNYSSAVDCYIKAGATSWRECLFAAQQQSPPLTPEKLQEIASTLADALLEAKDYTSAATIHIEYLNAIESAIQCFCKGYLFADAMRLVALRNRPDLLPTAIDTGLADAFSSSTEFLADCKAQLKAQVPRIAELRKKAREDPLAFYEGEYGRAEDIPDDVSVAASSRLSTSASLFTRYTGKAGSVGTVGSNVSRATSKNRKREEKKRARGRKGTVYEEEYLVNSVRRLVERVEGTKGEVERLVFGLVRRGMAERARVIEESMGAVMEACKLAVEEIWEVKQKEGEVNGDEEVEGVRATGGQGVFQESLEARKVKQEPPVVGAFARLELLGGKR